MKKLILLSIACTSLIACEQVTRENLGLAKQAPDEFSVVTRAPLSVPPDFSLRPPRPGASRPMEISTRDNARQTVFGVNDIDRDTGVARTNAADADSFLGKIGANQADPNIREQLDTAEPVDNRSTAEKLLFMSPKADVGSPIDPKAELDRLKNEGVVTIKKRNEDIEAP
jgi:hypothetical protein